MVSAVISDDTMICSQFVQLVIMLLAINTQAQARSYLVPNKYRYSTNNQDTQFDHETLMPSQTVNNYRINRDLTKMGNELNLDAEDKSLLEKFYQETRHQDPFTDDSFSSQTLWDESKDQDLTNVLLDVNQVAHADDWTIDSTLIEQAQKLTRLNYELGQDSPDRPNISASYSPTIKLLTQYNPIENSFRGSNNDVGQHRLKQQDRIVGATLFGRDEHSKPSLGSKSPVDAIKMHNELLEKPPKDGKVRVRMYFHKAIHDDIKLYGTGPWKYWGHGWGIEFGYDPRSNVNNDFYQKGYTIERAFGRDFCRDQKKCRPPDPDFLKTQQHNSIIHNQVL